MRPKFVAAVLSVSLLLSAGIWWSKKGAVATKAKDSNETAAQAISSPPVARAVRRIITPVRADNSTPEQQRAEIDAEVERLNQLSLKKDAASLPEVFAALKNPDREVREAAIDAVTQVGDSNAIPALEEASGMAEDPEEKVAFQEAVEFLSVPPLALDASSPVTIQKPTAIAERRQALRRSETEQEIRAMPSRAGNVSSGSVAE